MNKTRKGIRNNVLGPPNGIFMEKDFAGLILKTGEYFFSSYEILGFWSFCEEIKGILGAKKYPVKLANNMGMK